MSINISSHRIAGAKPTIAKGSLSENEISCRQLSHGVVNQLDAKGIRPSIAHKKENPLADEPATIVELSKNAKNALQFTIESRETDDTNLIDAARLMSITKPGCTREDYYTLCFSVSTDEAKAILGTSTTVSGSMADTTEKAISRYNELREHIKKEFSNDEKMLATHLNALDASLKTHLSRIGGKAAASLEMDSILYLSSAKNMSSIQDEFHPLATHKEFYAEEFKKNTLELMVQFAKQYTEQVKANSDDYLTAWSSTIEIMSAIKTTSINKLSLNDFMIYEATTPGELFEEKTKSGAIAAHGSLYTTFLNNPNLSEYLRNALGIA